MAVTFFPFNSIVVDGVPDRPANAENLAAYLAGFFSNGVLMHVDTALQVEAYSGMNVQINAGMGNINGKAILADAAEIIALKTASASLGRIDRVVFRLDETNRVMEFDVLTGTPASSPAAPELTRRADVYEMCLAEIRVPAGATSITASHITDTRADETLCGRASIPAHMQDLKCGGTGLSVNTAEELLLALGGLSIKMLWENASPTSNFREQQITIDGLNDYELFLTEFRLSASSAYRFFVISALGSTSPAQATMNVGGTASVTFVVRNVLYSVNGYVNFGACNYKKANDTDTQAASSYLIPVKSYGIKGVQ